VTLLHGAYQRRPVHGHGGRTGGRAGATGPHPGIRRRPRRRRCGRGRGRDGRGRGRGGSLGRGRCRWIHDVAARPGGRGRRRLSAPGCRRGGGARDDGGRRPGLVIVSAAVGDRRRAHHHDGDDRHRGEHRAAGPPGPPPPSDRVRRVGAAREVRCAGGRTIAHLAGRVVISGRVPSTVLGLPPARRGEAAVPLTAGVHPPIGVCLVHACYPSRRRRPGQVRGVTRGGRATTLPRRPSRSDRPVAAHVAPVEAAIADHHEGRSACGPHPSGGLRRSPRSEGR
jgi:hypothetical protein